MMGPCGLCRKSAQLRDSHLMPAAFYKLLRDPTKKNANPVVIRPRSSVITSKQVSSTFLCDECEDRFSRQGEKEVVSQCARKEGPFPLRACLDAATPFCVSQNPAYRCFTPKEVQGVKADAYLYFAASVFWRASAHSWEYSGEPVARIRLGAQYEEQFQEYLLGSSPFPSHARLFLQVDSELPPDMTCVFPCSSRVDQVHQHKFRIPGVTFVMFVGQHVPSLHDDAALNGSARQCIWLCPFREGSLFGGIADIMEKTVPRGSLKKP